MRRCLITFCPANHKMNRMVMVITEDSDLITVTPQGDGNSNLVIKYSHKLKI